MKKAPASSLAGIRPGFKLWLDRNSESVFGHGKWQLLNAIHRQGSLRAAAASLGISYRKAWGDLRKAEQALGFAFLDRHRGGSEGGETCLNETGRKWLAEYARFHADVEAGVERAFARWAKRMAR